MDKVLLEEDAATFSSIFTPNFFQEFVEEMIYGSFAGLALLVSGHPFDTIKTRMQVDNESFFGTIRRTSKNEGPLAFYKGIAPPLVTVPLVNASVFCHYTGMKNITSRCDYIRERPILMQCIAGGWTGLLSCLLNSPVELIKTRLQMQRDEPIKRYKNDWDCLKKIYKAEGVKGVYRGMLSCILRDVPSYIAQFVTYETLKDYFHRRRYLATGEDHVNKGELLMSGALAGLMAWGVSYPMDTIKSIIAADVEINPKKRQFKPIYKDGGITNCARHIYKTSGLIGFFRGFSAILFRATYPNALGFLAYEESKKIISINRLMQKY